MCGIAGFIGKERAVPYLIDCLERLEYRGYDSSGIALCENGGIYVTKRKGKLDELKKAVFSGRRSDSCCGIGHTRWATHGSPSEKNAHPHLSENGRFAVVHNGIIENYAELKKELVSEGVHFTSETDSEVIVQLFERNYSGDFSDAVRRTLCRLRGAYAIAVLCRDFPDRIFCARRGSPLILCESEKGCIVSSDVTSVAEYGREIYRLEDGECAFISVDGIEFYNENMKEITKHSEKLTVSAEDVRKQGYEHFMLKEIFEQDQTAIRTIDKHLRGDEIFFEETELFFSSLSRISRIAFIGCGSAYHVCLSAKYVTEKLTGIYCSAEIASEWRYGASPVDENTLCVFISQSGETADTVAALEKAKRSSAVTLGIVNVPSSSLCVKSDFVILTQAGAEIAVATTKAYTAQLLTVYMLALKIAKEKESIDKEAYSRYIDFLKKIPEGISHILACVPVKAEEIAEEIYNADYMYFIGRNTDYAAALEGALKLKEVSYIPCEAYPSGELKHGTISLIENRTCVVALSGNTDVSAKTQSNISEVKSRGAKLIVVGNCVGNITGKTDSEDRFIDIPLSESVFSALYESIVLQILAYYVAKRRGCDIDKPRNLAKSVTVE